MRRRLAEQLRQAELKKEADLIVEKRPILHLKKAKNGNVRRTAS
jgi:hypothetical protein